MKSAEKPNCRRDEGGPLVAVVQAEAIPILGTGIAQMIDRNENVKNPLSKMTCGLRQTG